MDEKKWVMELVTKNKFIIFSFIIIFFSFDSKLLSQTTGKYLYFDFVIELTEDGKYYNSSHFSRFSSWPKRGCESFGTYYKKGRYFYFSSNPLLDSNNINVIFYESKLPSDSNFITILSPYEKSIYQENWQRIYQYNITVYYTDTNSCYNKEQFITDTNKIQFKKNQIKKIDSILLVIKLNIEDNRAYYKSISTKYIFTDKYSNNLFIIIPNFDFYYFFYKRYENFPVYIKSRKKIIFKNNTYILKHY
jgi:hypothetical protein